MWLLVRIRPSACTYHRPLLPELLDSTGRIMAEQLRRKSDDSECSSDLLAAELRRGSVQPAIEVSSVCLTQYPRR